MRVTLIIINLVLLGLFAKSQDANLKKDSRIDRYDLQHFVEVLTSDSLEGRGTGTPGQIKTAHFISERFKKIGVGPYIGDNYLEYFKLKKTYWDDVYLVTEKKRLNNFVNIIYLGTKIENAEVEKEVVFGGYGTASDLSQIDVNNKLVLLFSKNLRSNFQLNNDLKNLNAYGIIVANPEYKNQFESIKNTYKNHALQKVFSLINSDTAKQTINRWGGNMVTAEFIIPNSRVNDILNVSIKNLQKATSNKEINKIPTSKVKVKMNKIVDTIQSANVCGTIKGSSQKSIIISAHYDHLGIIENNMFPGADDNASGIAALLEIAEEFSNLKNLKYNLIFIATSGEEQGLLGSKYHVSTNSFDPSNVICNLNLDMISRYDTLHPKNKNYLYCIGSASSNQLNSLLKKAADEFKLCTFDFSLESTDYPNGLYSRSDQVSFYRKGIPSINFFAGFHYDYHRPTDTADKINYSLLENRVRLISTFIHLIQNEWEEN